MGSERSTGPHSTMELDHSAPVRQFGDGSNRLRRFAWNALDGSHALLTASVAARGMRNTYQAASLHCAKRFFVRQSDVPIRHLADFGHPFSRQHEEQPST